MPVAYYVSDYAYSNLVTKAKELGYVAHNARRAEGMSKFLNSFSFLEFIDTRPPNVREEHTLQLARSTHPLWSIRGGEYKKPRLLSLSIVAVENYVSIGVNLGVIITAKLVNRGRILKTKEALASQVIEAIGIGYLSTVDTETNIGAIKIGAISRVEKVKRTRSKDTTIQEETSLSDYFR